MPLGINWPGDGAALQRFFGLKGRIPLAMDETVVPTVNVGDIEGSPWGATGVMRRLALPSPGVNDFGYVVWQPGAGVVLRIDQIFMRTTEGASQDFDLRLLTAAQFALLTIDDTNAFVNITNPIQPTGASERQGSRLLSAHHTATVGTLVARFTVPAGGVGMMNVTLTQPLFMNGDARGGVGAYGIVQSAKNKQIDVGVIGREYFNRS